MRNSRTQFETEASREDARSSPARRLRRCNSIVLPLLLFSLMVANTAARTHGKASDAPGFVIELPAPAAEVLQAVQEVAQDQIIHGTYQFEKEQTLSGAIEATSSAYFAASQDPAKVVYKTRANVLSPRHFRDSNDIGEITVRYVVQGVGTARTRLRIDAVFIEAARRRVHPSDGTVETSEFKAIQDHLRAIQLSAQEARATQENREKQELARQTLLRERQEESLRLISVQSSVRELQQRLQELRHQVELRVKEPGTELKSAPFHGAVTIQTLAASSELVVLIVTPHWYGVETPDGRRGWIHRQQVEPLP